MNPLAEAVSDLGEKLRADGELSAAIILHVTAGLLTEQNPSALHGLASVALQIARVRRAALTAMDN